MGKIVIASGAIALIAGGMMLPSLAQNGGRTITRETLTEPGDFIKVGGHVVNKAFIAYVAKSGNQSVVHFVGGAQPLTLFGEDMASIAQQLVPEADPNLPQMPNAGRSPFDLDAPQPGQRRSKRVLPSPGTPRPSEVAPPSSDDTVPPPTLPEPGSLQPVPSRPDR